MRIRKGFIAVLALTLPLWAGAQDIFKLSFHGTGRLLNESGMMQTRRVNTDDLIARCVGEAGLATNNQGTNRHFELAYNAGEDSVQVVNLTNGSWVCDVLQFQGTISNVDGRQISRMAFVFIPEQNEAVGSAILTDRVRSRNNRRYLHGQIQFALPSLELGSAEGAQFSAAPISNTNAVGTTNNAGSGGNGTNSSSGLGTNASITAPTVPVPPVVDTNPTLIVTNNLGGAGDAALTNSLLLPPPLPGSTAVVATNTTSGNASATNCIAIPMAALIAPGASTALTNAVVSSALTNAVLCSGTISVGKRIPVR
jgi:hypothetical protein